MIVEPTDEAIRLAAAALRAGHLVGMPTETVYGIAANALDEEAVLATFALKGRPAENPLIVHLDSFERVATVAAEIPDAARRLAAAFWPGPMTMVLPKSPIVPSVVTGGLPTVAVRVPGHPVALRLIGEAGVPVSAPSANRFMALSPTRAADISREIAAGLEVILDAGPCPVGIESLVVDLTGAVPTILRPGVISRERLKEVLGCDVEVGGERKSPGMYPRHYSPKTPMRLADRLGAEDAGLTFGEPQGPLQFQMPREPGAYAALLYAALARLDLAGLEEIVVERPPGGGDWAGVNDRLAKSVGKWIL